MILGWPAKRSASVGCLSGCPHSSVRQGVRSGMGRCGTFDLVLIQRLRVIVDVGQRRRDRNLARPVGVVGGSPGFRRGSARRANDEVDDGVLRGGRGSSWGGRNRWRPSSLEAAGSGEIPSRWFSPCSGNGVARSVMRGELNGVKNSSGVASIYSRARGPMGRTVSSSGAMVQTAIGMGEGRGRCGVPWRCSTTWFRGMGRCGLVWNMRRSDRKSVV